MFESGNYSGKSIDYKGPMRVSTCVHRAVCLCAQMHVTRTVTSLPPRKPKPPSLERVAKVEK